MELRTITTEVRLENPTDDDKHHYICGRIPYNSLSVDLGGFREKINPTSFVTSLSDGSEIWSYWQHDTNKPLARRSASHSSLELRHYDTHLYVRARLNDTSWAKDAHVAVADGLCDGMSFGFKTRKDTWSTMDGVRIRELHDVQLLEVSPVWKPAYGASTVDLRCIVPDSVLAVAQLNEVAFDEMLYRTQYQRQKEIELALHR